MNKLKLILFCFTLSICGIGLGDDGSRSSQSVLEKFQLNRINYSLLDAWQLENSNVTDSKLQVSSDCSSFNASWSLVCNFDNEGNLKTEIKELQVPKLSISYFDNEGNMTFFTNFSALVQILSSDVDIVKKDNYWEYTVKTNITVSFIVSPFARGMKYRIIPFVCKMLINDNGKNKTIVEVTKFWHTPVKTSEKKERSFVL